MPTLQVRDLPDEIYQKLRYLAEKEHRSLAQETIILLKEGLESKLSNKNRRKQLLQNFKGLNVNTVNLPKAVDLIREDRDNR